MKKLFPVSCVLFLLGIIPFSNSFSQEVTREALQQSYNLEEGKKTYSGTCAVCHNNGIMDAPKFGDKAAWAPIIAKTMTSMINNTVMGFNNMPPKGGKQSLTDTQIADAVAYIVEQSL